MKTLGIDLGSRAVKLACMEDGRLTETRSYSTAGFYRQHCRWDGRLTVDLRSLGFHPDDFAQKVSTGYGRNNTDLETFTPITEIRAHAHGAAWQTGLKSFTLLDLGGQDVKVLQVRDGMLRDLDLNDKCAASCGRYLENMSRVLEVDLEELSRHSADPVPLNATCAIFSESELIGKLAEGLPLERLCAGVNASMVNRILPMLAPYRGQSLLVSGGAARNEALLQLLNTRFGPADPLPDPLYNGAIGCCSYGSRIVST